MSNNVNLQENILENNNQAVENVSSEKYLTFFIDGQLYAIPSSEVVEIIRMQPITFMPKLPEFVKGVINLRGKIVPLIDLRLKFDLEERAYDDHTSIIVLDHNELSIGFIVDTVNDVTDIAENQISDAPKLSKTDGDNFVGGIVHLDQKVALMLDIAKVLEHEDAKIKNTVEADELE
ncbi:MAG TPA: chemotaxis protein CheW [Oscillospiraceae bacterium]|nr:chemotaxis protein CheW [Oscillospiraceae bacterium]